jgi:hypothetical protein
MTRAEVLEAMNQMLVAAQKVRSVSMEGLGDDQVAEDVNIELHPWLFGPKNCLPILLKYLTQAEAGGVIAGSVFYNWMTIATDKDPAIALMASLSGYDFPQPQVHWFVETW